MYISEGEGKKRKFEGEGEEGEREGKGEEKKLDCAFLIIVWYSV